MGQKVTTRWPTFNWQRERERERERNERSRCETTENR